MPEKSKDRAKLLAMASWAADDVRDPNGGRLIDGALRGRQCGEVDGGKLALTCGKGIKVATPDRRCLR